MTDTTTSSSPAPVSASESTPAAAPAPTYDPKKTYKVLLKRPVEWPAGSGFIHRAHDVQLMGGAVCEEIADAIHAANPV